MFIPSPFRGRPGERACGAIDFTPASTQVRRVSPFAGVVDGHYGVFSAWIRLDAGDGAAQYVWDNAANSDTDGVRVFRWVDNTIQVIVWTTAPATAIYVKTVGTYTASASWIHILVTWDVNETATLATMYVNDVEDCTTVTANETAYPVDYTTASAYVADRTGGGAPLQGAIAEVFLDTEHYLDLSVEANRRKFISANGKPMHLGTNGGAPFGAPAAVYLHFDPNEAPANFLTNRGYGGNFELGGAALTAASSSPSD